MAISWKRNKIPRPQILIWSRAFTYCFMKVAKRHSCTLFRPLSVIKKNTFLGCSRGHSRAVSGQNMPQGPFSALLEEKRNLQFQQKWARNCKICELFHWGIFTHFHSAPQKTHYILPPLPPGGVEGMRESGEDLTSLTFCFGASEQSFLLKSLLHCKVPNNYIGTK